MRKIILYTAISLDGFIAKEDGSIEWLNDPAWKIEGEDFGYSELLSSIDTTLMGGNTFRQVDGFEIPFPYRDTTNFVFSRRADEENEYVTFIRENYIDFITKLKKKKGMDIWLIGGGYLNGILHSYDLIDEYRLSYIPVFLGQGIPVFRHLTKESKMTLVENKSYSNGMVCQTYIPEKTEKNQ